jgi:dGTPase
MADALAALRSFNYEHVYLRPASLEQGASVVKVLRALVELYADRPNVLPAFGDGTTRRGLAAGSDAALREAVSYVAGMTDRFAFSQAVTLLGWDPAALPVGVGGR